MARCQRLKIFSLTVIGLGLSLALLFLSLDSFKSTTLRFQDISDITNLKTCFDNYLLSKQDIYKEFEDNISQTIVNTNTYLSTFNKEKALALLSNTLNILHTFLMMFLNVGINIILFFYIFIRESIYGTKLKIKYSKTASILIKIRQTIILIINKIKSLINAILKALKQNKKYIFILILIILLSNGFIYRFLIEFIIFIEAYIYNMINFTINKVIESIVKSIIIFIIPIIKKIPSFLWWILLYIILFLFGFSKQNIN